MKSKTEKHCNLLFQDHFPQLPKLSGIYGQRAFSLLLPDIRYHPSPVRMTKEIPGFFLPFPWTIITFPVFFKDSITAIAPGDNTRFFSHNHRQSRWLAQPCKGMLPAGLKAHRNFRHLQICPTAPQMQRDTLASLVKREVARHMPCRRDCHSMISQTPPQAS